MFHVLDFDFSRCTGFSCFRFSSCFAVRKICFTSRALKIQEHKNRHTQKLKNGHTEKHKHGHILNKKICFRFTDFDAVSAVGKNSFALNAVEVGGRTDSGDCRECMRRIVQIPDNAFSVGPRGPVLVVQHVPFDLLIFKDPSGSPGEPWRDVGTLGECDFLIFRFSKPWIFANWQQVATTKWRTRPTCSSTGTTSLAALPPLGSSAAVWGLSGVVLLFRVPLSSASFAVCVCVVCHCARACVCPCVSMFVFACLCCSPCFCR